MHAMPCLPPVYLPEEALPISNNEKRAKVVLVREWLSDSGVHVRDASYTPYHLYQRAHVGARCGRQAGREISSTSETSSYRRVKSVGRRFSPTRPRSACPSLSQGRTAVTQNGERKRESIELCDHVDHRASFSEATFATRVLVAVHFYVEEDTGRTRGRNKVYRRETGKISVMFTATVSVATRSSHLERPRQAIPVVRANR